MKRTERININCLRSIFVFLCDTVSISIDYFVYVSRSETHRGFVDANYIPSQRQNWRPDETTTTADDDDTTSNRRRYGRYYVARHHFTAPLIRQYLTSDVGLVPTVTHGSGTVPVSSLGRSVRIESVVELIGVRPYWLVEEIQSSIDSSLLVTNTCSLSWGIFRFFQNGVGSVCL